MDSECKQFTLFYCFYPSYFVFFHSCNKIYHPNQVGSALMTLLVGSEAETGNAGIICVQDIVFQTICFPPYFNTA